MFQSSPSPKAGSYRLHCWRGVGSGCFNPLPARRPGATALHVVAGRMAYCFNPLPARRPGATHKASKVPPKYNVSILSQPEGRELHQFFGKVYIVVKFQSSPSPKAGSYWRCRR